MEESKILHLLWHRLESGIDALQQTYGKRLLQTAMNILGDRQDAEEAVNDTYLALWNAIPPARPHPLCAYVYKVGRNTALKHLRRKEAQKRQSGFDLSLDELAQILPGDTLEETLDAKALGQAIDGFLGTLSRENRVLFIRRYWFGDDLAQLAKAHRLTSATLSVRLHRIREKLKRYLIQEGFFYEA